MIFTKNDGGWSSMSGCSHCFLPWFSSFEVMQLLFLHLFLKVDARNVVFHHVSH